MPFRLDRWRHWLALTTIVWGVLMCCCPSAKAAIQKSASCCAAKTESHCPVSKDGESACGFIQLRQSLALAPAVDQIDGPQVCFIAELPPAIVNRPTLVAQDVATLATPPPLQTLLDLHCSLVC